MKHVELGRYPPPAPIDVRYRINRSGNAAQRRKARRLLKKRGYKWEPSFHGFVNWREMPHYGRKAFRTAIDALAREVEQEVLSGWDNRPRAGLGSLIYTKAGA